MMPFFTLLILVLVIWLLIRSLQAKDQIAEVESRLTQLQYELERLKSERKSPAAAKAEQPPTEVREHMPSQAPAAPTPEPVIAMPPPIPPILEPKVRRPVISEPVQPRLAPL